MIETLAIALPLITIAFFLWFFMRTRRPRKGKNAKVDDRTRQERAVWAWAKVVSSSQEPVNTYRMARVTLDLEVHMPGNPAYQVKTTWLVDQEAVGVHRRRQRDFAKSGSTGSGACLSEWLVGKTDSVTP